jgi:hypothetical protein
LGNNAIAIAGLIPFSGSPACAVIPSFYYNTIHSASKVSFFNYNLILDIQVGYVRQKHGLGKQFCV